MLRWSRDPQASPTPKSATTRPVAAASSPYSRTRTGRLPHDAGQAPRPLTCDGGPGVGERRLFGSPFERSARSWVSRIGAMRSARSVPKVVFSRTLAGAGWPESQIASGELAADIDRLKREPGGVIVAHGGATRH